jgi:hypothetical protein
MGHNLGAVTGSGTLYLESQVIPAGKYTSILDCSNNSTLEYGGLGSYTLLADLYDQVPDYGSQERALEFYLPKF